MCPLPMPSSISEQRTALQKFSSGSLKLVEFLRTTEHLFGCKHFCKLWKLYGASALANKLKRLS